MSAPQYPIGTLRDILAIPDDARERFAAELPDILRTMDQMADALPAMAAEAYAKMPAVLRWLISPEKFAVAMARQMATKTVWIDDNKRTGTITMRTHKGAEPFFARTEPMDGEAA